MAATIEQQAHENVGASKSAIQHHYDVGNALYERFLGPTMAYSAGCWHEPATRDTLDDAQNRKLDWHIDWSGADTARHVLDIGCGWGSLIRRMTVRNPNAEIVGITMSDAQAAYLHQSFDGRAEIAVMPWQQYRSNRQFEGIVSVGAIEHFATIDITREQRIQAYRDFFEFCAAHLMQRGRVSLQTVVWNNVLPGTERQYDFSHFFPESCPPHVPDLVAAADGLFHVVRLEVSSHDYIYTLREWLRNLRSDEANLRHEFGSNLVQWYIDNFTTVLHGFVAGVVSLSRMALELRGAQVAWKR
jgi:cyclopropane-fatty-acyl-phospholipid synthase